MSEQFQGELAQTVGLAVAAWKKERNGLRAQVAEPDRVEGAGWNDPERGGDLRLIANLYRSRIPCLYARKSVHPAGEAKLFDIHKRAENKAFDENALAARLEAAQSEQKGRGPLERVVEFAVDAEIHMYGTWMNRIHGGTIHTGHHARCNHRSKYGVLGATFPLTFHRARTVCGLLAILDTGRAVRRSAECMNHFNLLCELAERAGVSPASMLYAFIEDTMENAADDFDFQRDWVEVAGDKGEIPEAVDFFQRLLKGAGPQRS